MTLDYTALDLLRQNHPAWRLLRSDHAPLLASFLHRAFIAPNVRTMPQSELAEALEDTLFGLREQLGADAFPKSGAEYLNDWAAHDKGWLRKFYSQDSDEPQFDLTPAAEKAIAWLGTLTQRAFVGTESRLLTLFEQLREMNAGSQPDPQARIAELQRRRDDIDAEMAGVIAGDMALLDDTALKERFQQFTALARDLLTDFREVEHNFRMLDRRVRERIALWGGGKGMLLEQIMGERDAIANSDEGRSFQAFWDFLMSNSRQEELTQLLDRVLSLPPVQELKPDARTRRIHYDWLDAGEHTQRTVSQLSRQLRRFLDDKAWLENRRIMEILHEVESHALALRDAPPAGPCMSMDDTAAAIELPMERPLHAPAIKPRLDDSMAAADAAEIDAGALFSQFVIDKARLSRNISQALQQRSQITLRELCEAQPVQQGLAEVVAYLELAGAGFPATVDEQASDTIAWTAVGSDGRDCLREARLPRIIFLRQA
jgi:hypothetical protein